MKRLLTLILAVCGFAAAQCAELVPAKTGKVAFEPSEKAYLLKNLSDDMLSWHFDTGRYYLRYDWDKPAVVYSLSMADGQKLAPGRELMVVQPQGRSKGKVKTNYALRVVRINPKVKPAAILTPGEWIACFETINITHDSVDNRSATTGKMPGWGKAFKGLWHSTGIYDIIRQTRSDFKNTWTLGLGRVLIRLQLQHFGDPPPGINEDQNAIHPRFRLMFPKGVNFFIGERNPACGWDWGGSDQFGIAFVDHIQFQGKVIQMPPKVLDSPLGGITLSTFINGFLHLEGSDRFIWLVHQL